jgi:hypothetical protein
VQASQKGWEAIKLGSLEAQRLEVLQNIYASAL